MNSWSRTSAHRLETCHEDLIRVFDEVLQVQDCSVLYGHRGETDQNMMFDRGFSMLMWPNSTHNKVPSEGIDVLCYPVDWEDINGMYHLAGIVKGVCFELGIDIEWGGDWETFFDGAHYQLRR